MNTDKTISANSRGILIQYDENEKAFYKAYDAVRNLQINGSSYKGVSYQEPDKQKQTYSMEFNLFQHRLYEKTLYGLSKYSDKEVAELKPFEIALIDKKKKSLWVEMNKWKNEVMYNSLNQWFFKNTRSGSTLVKFLTEGKTDKSMLHVPNRKSFADLGLDKFKIARKMVALGFLPANFFELA